MKSERGHAAPIRDLDPFSLPTETRGRYWMLITAMVLFAWGAAGLVAPSLKVTEKELQEARLPDGLSRGIEATDGLEGLTTLDLQYISDPGRIGPSLKLLEKWLARMGLSLILVLLVAGAATISYRLHPRWRGLARRARPLEPDEAPRAVAELRTLVARAGLPASIELVHTPGHFTGIAFGTPGSEQLALAYPRGLLDAAWDRTLRPVAYHELGHFANQDIRRQEITRAMGISTVLLALGVWLREAFVNSAPGTAEAIPRLAMVAVRSFALLGALWWIWLGLVRVREFYADWRAVSWGEGEALRARLRLRPSHLPWWQRRKSARRFLARHPRLERGLEALRDLGAYHHPSQARRLAVLDDADPLFRVSPALAFLTGLLVTTVLANAGAMFSDVVRVARSVMTLLFFAIGPPAVLALLGIGLGALGSLALLLTSTLGVQVQREAVADLATGSQADWGYLRQGRTALRFALGLEAGLLATRASFLLVPVHPLYELAWLAVFTLLTWMWLVYCRAMARFVLGSAGGPRPPRRRQTLLTWASACLMAVLYSPALALRVTLDKADDPELLRLLSRGGESPHRSFVILFVLSSLILLALALLVYFLLGFASVGAAAAWLGFHRQTCEVCGTPTPARLVLGQRCPSCGRHLASWPFLETSGRAETAR